MTERKTYSDGFSALEMTLLVGSEMREREMRVYLQWMRRLAVSVFFSVMFLFGMLSPNIFAVESQNSTQANFVYTVKAGDTLYRIALEYGVTVRQLVAVNNIAQPNLIRLGQKIIIPVTNFLATIRDEVYGCVPGIRSPKSRLSMA